MANFCKTILDWVFAGFTKSLALILSLGLFSSQILNGADLHSGFIQQLHLKNAAIADSEGRVKLNFPYYEGVVLTLNKEIFRNTKLRVPHASQYDLAYDAALPVLFILQYSLKNSISIEGLPLEHSPVNGYYFPKPMLVNNVCYMYGIGEDWLSKWDDEEKEKLLNAIYVLLAELQKNGTLTMADIAEAKTTFYISEVVYSRVIKRLEDEQAERDRKQREIDEEKRKKEEEAHKIQELENQKKAEEDRKIGEKNKRETMAREFLLTLKWKVIAKDLAKQRKKGKVEPCYRIQTTGLEQQRNLWQTAMNLHNAVSGGPCQLEIRLVERVKRGKYEYRIMYDSVYDQGPLQEYENMPAKYELVAVPVKTRF